MLSLTLLQPSDLSEDKILNAIGKDLDDTTKMFHALSLIEYIMKWAYINFGDMGSFAFFFQVLMKKYGPPDHDCGSVIPTNLCSMYMMAKFILHSQMNLRFAFLDGQKRVGAVTYCLSNLRPTKIVKYQYGFNYVNTRLPEGLLKFQTSNFYEAKPDVNNPSTTNGFFNKIGANMNTKGVLLPVFVGEGQQPIFQFGIDVQIFLTRYSLELTNDASNAQARTFKDIVLDLIQENRLMETCVPIDLRTTVDANGVNTLPKASNTDFSEWMKQYRVRIMSVLLDHLKMNDTYRKELNDSENLKLENKLH